MPRIYLSARGEVVDFDAAMIKQQLAAAPMTVDVEKRKTFVDSKEVRKKPDTATAVESLDVGIAITPVDTFEVDEAPKAKKKA
jgi:hypothetical protein